MYPEAYPPGNIYNCNLNSFQANLKADTREEKMTVEKQEVYLSNRRSFYRTELLKSAFIVMSLV